MGQWRERLLVDRDIDPLNRLLSYRLLWSHLLLNLSCLAG